jgi:hypothetical protein
LIQFEAASRYSCNQVKIQEENTNPMRTLTNDSRGTAAWIEREAEGMDPLQLYREFVQNGIEAGASAIIIDGWTDPETGHRLARITDNGSGLTEHQLVERLTSLHGQFKADNNYGVGARIAALPFNHGGVTFASRTDRSEAMVMLHKLRGEYGMKAWEVEDEDGDHILLDVVGPDPGMLERLPEESTGTAVILHGDGHCDTWDASISYQVHKFLSRRYYDFGPNVSVYVQQIISGNSKGLVPVNSLGKYLKGRSEADGELAFRDVAGLDGRMLWWIIPTASDVLKTTHGGTAIPGGIGLVVENEIFNYDKSYLGDFGVIYPSVAARVAILIVVDGAKMSTARADVVLPGGNRRNIPWKKLGAHFAENMPSEIEELLSAVTVTTASFDAEMAKLLDKDWMKRLAPVKVHIPSGEGEPSTGKQSGDGLPKGEDIPPLPKPKPQQHPKPKLRAGEREHSGNEPGKSTLKVVTPQVQFIDEWDWDQNTFGIRWYENSNTIMIANDFPPYKREVESWSRKVTASKAIVERAVQGAYQVEFAATIIDANAQLKWKLHPEQVEALKSEAALYAKALGMQALTERIEDYIRHAAKNA